MLVVTVGVLGSLEAFFLPPLQSSLLQLVEGPAMSGMVSLDSTDRLGRILGPGLVGVLAAVVSTIHLMTIDAVSFLLSAIALTMLLRHVGPPARSTATPVNIRSRRALTGGWRAIHQRPLLREASCCADFATSPGQFTVAVPFAVAHRHHHDIAGYGFVLAVFGGGNLFGNVASAGIASHPALWCASAWTASGIGFLALAASPTCWLFVTIAGVGICTRSPTSPPMPTSPPASRRTSSPAS